MYTCRGASWRREPAEAPAGRALPPPRGGAWELPPPLRLICMYIYLYLYLYLSISLSLSLYIYIYMYVCVYIYIYIYIYSYFHEQGAHIATSHDTKRTKSCDTRCNRSASAYNMQVSLNCASTAIHSARMWRESKATACMKNRSMAECSHDDTAMAVSTTHGLTHRGSMVSDDTYVTKWTDKNTTHVSTLNKGKSL